MVQWKMAVFKRRPRLEGRIFLNFHDYGRKGLLSLSHESQLEMYAFTRSPWEGDGPGSLLLSKRVLSMIFVEHILSLSLLRGKHWHPIFSPITKG